MVEDDDSFGVLVLEDDPRVAGFLIDYVKNYTAFTPSAAQSVSEAEQKIIEDENIIIVLCDLLLRGPLGGVDFLRRCREREKHGLRRLEFVFMTGLDPEGDKFREMINLGVCAFLGKPVQIRELDESLQKALDNFNKNRGCLLMLSDKEDEPDEESKLALSFLYNYTAYPDSAIKFLHMLQKKNGYEYIGRHVKRVLVSVRQVSEEMGLEEIEIRTISTAASLFEIGMILVPDETLAKTSALTTKERDWLNLHPVFGSNIVRALPCSTNEAVSLEDVADIVLHHHESFGGGGYPSGISGEEIPLGSRVIAVCNAWHALVSTRPYRSALTREEARNKLRSVTKQSFSDTEKIVLDPEIVQILFSLPFTWNAE